MFSREFVGFAVLWIFVLADGQVSLTGKFGEDITLVPGDARLLEKYEIIWSYGQVEKKVLIHNDNGEWRENANNKYQLDEETGSLIIRSLITNDSGVYQVQIIIGSNIISKEFNLTVVDPDPTPSTGLPWALWVTIGLIGLVLIIVLVIKRRERIKGIFRGQFTPCNTEDPGRQVVKEEDPPV